MYRGHDIDLSRSRDVIDHVTNLVSHYKISYRCSIDADLLNWTVFQILNLIVIYFTILAFQDHVTSSVTWPFNSVYTISYRCFTGADTVSVTDFEILSIKKYWGRDLDLSRSRDVINHVTIRFALRDFLWLLHRNHHSISNRFWDINVQMYRGHDLHLSRSRDVIDHVTIRLPYMTSYRFSIDTDALFELFSRY